MHRRAFLGTLAGGLLAAPLAAGTQHVRKIPRIGFLAMGQHPSFAVFTRSLEDLGYVDRRNVSLEPRFAEIGRPDQFDTPAGEVWRLYSESEAIDGRWRASGERCRGMEPPTSSSW